ncbi:hypothetical protein [Streptomyces wuyuanensis]
MAFSRVFVGVHRPHDTAAGLLPGAAVAAASVRVPIRPAASPVTHRHQPLSAAAVVRGPGPAGEAVPAARFPATDAGVKYTDPDAGVYSDPDPLTGRPERIRRVRR